METQVLNASDTEIRQRILLAAREQFLMFGFSRVTVDEIANKVGMSKKTLYRLFPSKEELVNEVVRHEVRHVEHLCAACMSDGGDDFVVKLKKVMSVVGMQYAKIRPPLIEDLKKYAPHAWQEIAAHRTKMIMKDFGALLQEGVSAGVFRPDVKLDILLKMYTTCMEQIINPDSLSELPYSPDQVFESIITILFEGVFTEEALTKYRTHPV